MTRAIATCIDVPIQAFVAERGHLWHGDRICWRGPWGERRGTVQDMPRGDAHGGDIPVRIDGEGDAWIKHHEVVSLTLVVKPPEPGLARRIWNAVCG